MAQTRKGSIVAATITIIHWKDAVADAGWDIDVFPNTHDCITAGFLVAESEGALIIASTVSGTSTNARMHIPKAWILHREEISIENQQRKSKRTKPSAVGKRHNNKGVQP